MNPPLRPGDLATDACGVRIDAVNMFYGANHVLKDVNLDIRPGEFFAFLGPSGCGKTTLLRAIAGFAQPQTGRVLIGDDDVSRLPPWKRDVGLVFQSYALWPHLTVRRNVAFGLEERKVPRRDIARRVAAALDLVGMAAFAERLPSQLSGGQQQRVAVARTVAIEPKVLLLDEPLSNLDARLRVQVRRELRDLQRRLGITAIFVTHDQEEANTMCDRIAVMSDGVVQQVGTPIELYEHPANLFVASFLGTANILEGEVVGSGTERAFVTGGIRVPVSSAAIIPAGARMVFRPQDTRIGPDERGTTTVPGTIGHREFLGSTVRYGVRVGATEIAVDTPFHSGDPLHESGAQVTVAVPSRSLLWLLP
ncbi:MAG TPA: ABC transporter ATP-binding protein [Beijerinckiaceae bacterium]|nr:ABC transporter ATP-binding protein [Beijerinckiaceae bacterium]